MVPNNVPVGRPARGRLPQAIRDRWPRVVSLETVEGRRWLSRLAWALFCVALLAVILIGANGPADPHLAPILPASAAQHSVPSRVPGFPQVALRMFDPSTARTAVSGCALLADTIPRQERGMMGRRDLGGYDAMVFTFPAATTVAFYNKDVPIALSLAWFDDAGVYLGQAELPVCGSVCPTVTADQAFRYAVEVPSGGLHRLHVGQGAALSVGGAC